MNAFSLAEARFTNLDVQKRINELSERGRADDNALKESKRRIEPSGTLRAARRPAAALGSPVQRPGRHRATGGLSIDLHREAIDFRGDLLLEARLADMTTGFKSLLARLAQPFFRGPNGGTRLPIIITGTRSRPSLVCSMSVASFAEVSHTRGMPRAFRKSVGTGA